MKTLVISLCAVFILAGCGKKPPSPGQLESSHQARGDISPSTTAVAALEKIEDDSENERLIVSTAEFQLETLHPDSAHRKISDIARRYNGHVLLYENDRTIIRVPSADFFDAIAEIELLGDITDRHISGADVTAEYHDLEIRLDNAMKTRDRYLKLLDRADNLTDIFRVEKELERINQLIDLLKGRLEQLSHQIGYSKITVSTGKKVKSGPVSYIFCKLFDGVSWLFVRN